MSEEVKTFKVECKVQSHGFDGIEISQEIQQPEKNDKKQVAQAQMQKIAKKQFTERMKELTGNALNKAYKHYCNVELKKPEELTREQKINIIKSALDNLEDTILDKLYLQYGSTGLTENGKKKEIRQALKEANVEELLYFVATFKPARKTATKKTEEPKSEEPKTAETSPEEEEQFN